MDLVSLDWAENSAYCLKHRRNILRKIYLPFLQKSSGKRKKRRHPPEKPGKCRRKMSLNAEKQG